MNQANDTSKHELSVEAQILHDLIVAERNDEYFPMTKEENAVLYKYKNLIYKAMIKYKNM